MDLDEALDRLYAAPLEAFTATRNELAKELGPEGAQVKALKKPNLAAWALNQLAHRHAEDLEELFRVTDQVRREHRRVLSGGKASALREATDARAKVVNVLTKRTADILTDAGHAAAPTTLAAISGSLMAIAGDNEAVELLRKGQLSRELTAESVVDVGGGLTLIEGDGEPDATEEAPDQTEKLQTARAAVNDARERAQSARKAVKAAESEAAERVREADEAERAAKAAREAAEFARRAAEARKAEADEALRALDEAQKALKDDD